MHTWTNTDALSAAAALQVMRQKLKSQDIGNRLRPMYHGSEQLKLRLNAKTKYTTEKRKSTESLV
jgi:hypothetical protein